MEKKFDFNALADAHKSGGNPFDALFGPKENSAPPPQTKLTTRGWFENWLYQHGIFEDVATKIMDYVIPKVDAQIEADAQPGQTGYKITWNRPADEYPEQFYGVLIFTQKIKQHVFDWANENMPLAFWKIAFDPNFKMPGK